MHFPHIFLFTSVTSRGSIDINVIAMFNNQPCMNLKDKKMIKIKLFVNNVTQFTAYLANDFITLFVNNVACFTAYLIDFYLPR